jgi:hypothetical protein
MINNRITAICFAGVMTLITPATFGNDIVDFLRAVNSVQRNGHHGAGHRGFNGPRFQPIRHRGLHQQLHRPRRPVAIHIGHNPVPGRVIRHRPVVVNPILHHAPDPSLIGGLPHQLGEIVTCHVPLESHVIVRNAHEIAPGAQPIVVAVRNPHLAAWGSYGCVEQLSYVQVFAPPCPLRNVTVSPCHTVIELDYGDFEITLRSGGGVIEVEYDD